MSRGLLYGGYASAILAVALLLTGLPGPAPAEAMAKQGHVRALQLVLAHAFTGPRSVMAEAERETRADDASARAWRVRGVAGVRDRYDVIFYLGDRPACVWRVELAERRVYPEGCSLELWSVPPA